MRARRNFLRLAARLSKSATKKTASVAVIYHPQGEIGEAPMNDAEVKNLIAAKASAASCQRM